MRIFKNLPYLTLSLVLANFAVFFLQPGLNPTPDSPADLALRVIWPLPIDVLERLFSGSIIQTALVIPGLVVPLFMHANLEHIVGNMIGLFVFGSLLEWKVGKQRMLTIYMVTGLAGQLLTVLMNIRGLGASGAICGVMGAYLILVAWPPTIWRNICDRRIMLALCRALIGYATVHLVLALALQVLSGKTSDEIEVDGQVFGVGDAVHLVGFIAGIGMSTCAALRDERKRWQQRSEQNVVNLSGPITQELTAPATATTTKPEATNSTTDSQ